MAETRSILHSPYSSGSPIPSAEPQDLGLQHEILDQVDKIIQKQYPKMRSFLLLHSGKLVYERYYGGHSVSSLNDLRSATKSFTSILFGIALSRGELPDLNSSIKDIFQRYIPERAHPLLHKVSLHHLLTMTSGFAWQTGKKLGEPLIHRFHRNRKWTSFALSLPVVEQEMGLFQYRSTDSHLLSVAISEATGMDAYTYARQHLFGPLGIHHAAWSPSPEGHSMGHVGLYLTSRDMAKFGLCCLDGGRWEGERLIPESWLEQALTPQVKGYPAFGDYGFQWWNGMQNGTPFALAHGHGGQQIYLFPKLDTVVVFTADSKVSRWKNPRVLLERHILDAIQSKSPPSSDDSD
ncbi:serine hydrolase [Paenibacillus glucanolyticus]|jgi:CubicO group peptidase (beta-lactamase class C family)|uniref:serine hydrolase domain-containing protein n=1 Tax=Paenibacillus TaxID=44249 RepID=UPI0003E22D83|nr:MULTISPECIES: serine hydrolase [Paenibacillus]ANA80800.1 serine hydrolase [Paenibacillus glucanolyticus]AVV55127.1 serine hydrolase [Paenibacillus glucanolyticus]ETT31054.1 beta-lactamase [Paenibacillus sp. FSL R5-808]OMF81602.1 serine hydrolase [Paenibacillus glucanolyticus]